MHKMKLHYIFDQRANLSLSKVLRAIIGIVFLLSAYTKFISPGIVEIILVEHRIFSTRETAAIFVRILIGLEFALGTLFFLKYEFKRVVLPASLFFLISFTIYLIYAGFILNDNHNCGCFGISIEMTPLESIIKNIFLIGLIFWLNAIETENKRNILLPFAVSVLFCLIVFLVAPIKSYQDFKFSNFTYFTGKGRVDLGSGNKFLIIMNTECEHCQALAKELSILKKNGTNLSEFYSLLYSEGDISVDSFKVLTGFNFPYHTIDVKNFFDLIGTSPPRIYWIKDGMIKEVWDSNFVENISKLLN